MISYKYNVSQKHVHSERKCKELLGIHVKAPMVVTYKGSAPRAADAARHARARKNTTKCEGGRKKRAMILCIS